MTLFIPDISHHQAGIDIHALKMQEAAALIARVGQAAGRRSNGLNYGTVRDREWARHRDEARRVGLPLVAYWYTGNLLSAPDNAAMAAGWVGDPTVPWMIDHEDASGTISHYLAVVKAFRDRGMRVILGYVPRWYWASQGALNILNQGPPLVNSRYGTATGTPAQIYAAAGGDAGSGWGSYGGQQVALWQFTNKASMAGMAIDCSAFRGSLTQLKELIYGNQESSMHNLAMVRQPSTGAVIIGDGMTRRHLATPQDVDDQKYIASKLGITIPELGDVENIGTLGIDVAAALNALADDETKIIQAVRTIVEADTNTELTITPEQLLQLADAVVTAVPPHVREAVRQAFARAGGVPDSAGITIPDMTGMTVQQAGDALAALGWLGDLDVRGASTTDAAALNTVVNQTPDAGQVVDAGAEIVLVVANTLVT